MSYLVIWGCFSVLPTILDWVTLEGLFVVGVDR